MAALAVYASLFAAAFVAATILPAQSEAVLASLLAPREYSATLLIAVATAGNTLGACVNWWLGRHIGNWKSSRWFPVSETKLLRWQGVYRRWGRWSLLLSWMPFGGDALTVVAGVMREPLWSFTAIVAIAKLARYLAVAAAVYGLM
jgi:membrane protein YqaA with SNARE-associated domain